MGILAKSYADDEFSRFLVRNEIKHYRIPLYSAWIGGLSERMIRTLKSTITKLVGRKQLEYFQFISLLSDVQNAINSRPLTYIENEVSFVPLTPNCFLKNDTGVGFVLDNVSGEDLILPNRKDLVKSLEKREDLFNMFKCMWFDQYLLSLRETTRDLFQSQWEDKIKVGDVVMVSTPNKSRAFWNLARVLELLTGQDKRTRTVRVVRSDGQEAVHSINHLYPLEIEVTPEKAPTEEEKVDFSLKNDRPVRAAALKCLEKLQSN